MPINFGTGERHERFHQHDLRPKQKHHEYFLQPFEPTEENFFCRQQFYFLNADVIFQRSFKESLFYGFLLATKDFCGNFIHLQRFGK
jgi:hypothetical protein